MKKLGIVFVLALFVYAAPAPTSNPGVVFEVETTYHSGSGATQGPESSQMSVEGKLLKMEILPSASSGGRGAMIFRGDRGEHGEMIVVDHDEKSYMVMDDESIQAIAGQVGEAMGAVEEALKNLPKEQRDAIEKARKQGGIGAGAMKPRAKPEVRKTGERAEKEGYPCVKYDVLQEGRKVRELWVTDWDNIDGGDEAAAAFRRMGAFFEAMVEALPPMPGGEGPFGGENPYDEMFFEDGFPVVTRAFDDGGDLESESTLRSTRRRTLDPAEFEPPAGYKRRSMGPR